MTQALSAEEKLRLRKQWTELAIKQAQEGLWAEAVTTNKNIINLFPSEPDVYNRLGKAYSELGQYTEARQAYSQTLKINPGNTIAKKNLDRLQSLQDIVAPQGQPGATDRIDPRAFIEETGKTGISQLINLAPQSVLSRVSYGDRMNLHVSGHRLLVQNSAGETVGQVEPRLANRLISYIESGNRYGAAVLAIDKQLVRVIIREEYQHPSMFGKVSFPSQGGSGELMRAYTKDSMLRHDREDEDELGLDDEYYDGGDEVEEVTEMDFDAGNGLED